VCASADKANAQVLTVRALLKAGAAAGQSGNREQTALHIAAADVIKVKHVAAGSGLGRASMMVEAAVYR